MSYTPKIWTNNDPITINDLNNLEENIKNNALSESLIVNDINGTLDKNYTEIKNAILSGQHVFIKTNLDDNYNSIVYSPIQGLTQSLNIIQNVINFKVVTTDTIYQAYYATEPLIKLQQSR